MRTLGNDQLSYRTLFIIKQKQNRITGIFRENFFNKFEKNSDSLLTSEETANTENLVKLDTMDHNQLSNAFFRVGLVADQTWWNNKDYSDDFKLASLGLWNEVIQSNERLSNIGTVVDQTIKDQPRSRPNVARTVENQNFIGNHILSKKENKLLMPSCRMEVAQVQKALATMDPTVPAPLPQSILTDTRCILSANWPLALLKTYPAISTTLKDPSSRSVFSHKHTIGGIYKDGNTLPYSINTVEELLYHKKLNSPTIKAIWSNEEKSDSKKDLKGGVWGPGLNANVPEFYPSVLLPPRQCPPRYSNIFGANYQSEVFPYNEEKPLEKRESEMKSHKKKSRRGMSEQRNSLQSPEGKEKEVRMEVNLWLQNVYPHRVMELSRLGAIARHLEAVNQQVAHPFPQAQVASSSATSTQFPPTSERRLYRDVLARKIEEAADKVKDDGEQNPFDELERQALEQYQSSETCLVTQTNSNDLGTDPLDSKFQDLEREALEQYTEDPEDVGGTSSHHIKTNSTPNKKLSAETLEENAFLHIDHSHYHANKALGSSMAKYNLDDETIIPESIVKSVVEDDKSSTEIFSVAHGQNAHCSDEAETSLGQYKGRRNNKKKKKKLSEDEVKHCNKQLQEKIRSMSGNSISYQLSNAVNVEDETRRLATNLKHKVLNYLRSVDLKITDESRKTNIKYQIKESIERPIQERIRVTDIVDLETYKTYIREVSSKARTTLLVHFKRIRSEIMESTSRGMVTFVSPTTTEKRKTRKIIKKCLELRNHADTMNKMPRNPLNTIKREVNETLEMVHHTMEVIYTLSNMSKEAHEDVEYLKNGKGLVADLYTESITLEDKSEYIKQRIMLEERSVLMVILFPRRSGILFDRVFDNFETLDSQVVNYDHDMLRLDYEIQLRAKPFPAETLSGAGYPHYDHDPRVSKQFLFPRAKMDSKDIWDENNWIHVLRVGGETRDVSIELFSTAQKAGSFFRVIFAKLSPLKLLSSSIRKEETHSPRKRRLTDTSDPPSRESRKRNWSGQTH